MAMTEQLLRHLFLRRLQHQSRRPVEQRQVRAGEYNSHYYVAGEEDAPPIILLHGAGSIGIIWYPVMEALARTHRVIVPDIVGYGASDKPKLRYDRRFYCSWLYEFMTALGIKSADLVGNSQGGAIAIQFAHDAPTSVERLILVDTAALGTNPPPAVVFAFSAFRLLPSIATGILLNSYVLAHPEQLDPLVGYCAVRQNQSLGSRRSFVLGHGRALVPFSTRSLSSIAHETLLIWGREDSFFPIEDAQLAQRVMPNAHLRIIEDAGHCPWVDQPEEFNAILSSFLVS